MQRTLRETCYIDDKGRVLTGSSSCSEVDNFLYFYPDTWGLILCQWGVSCVRCMLESPGSCSLCCNCAGFTGIAGVVQRLPGSLGLRRVYRGRWGCSAYVRVAQHVSRSLGLRSVCRDHWDHAVCAGVAGIIQCELEREKSAKFTKEMTRSSRSKGFRTWHDSWIANLRYCKTHNPFVYF